MVETGKKQIIANKYLGKGKKGRFCPFRQGNFCNENCGLFCDGLSMCVLHGINWNLQKLAEKENDKEK